MHPPGILADATLLICPSFIGPSCKGKRPLSVWAWSHYLRNSVLTSRFYLVKHCLLKKLYIL